MNWAPVTRIELLSLLRKSEAQMPADMLKFWYSIKVEPKKWTEEEFGDEGGGFWIVAICGKSVIWYNDIEEGFNISSYKSYGEIEEYLCNQDELWQSVRQLYNLLY